MIKKVTKDDFSIEDMRNDLGEIYKDLVEDGKQRDRKRELKKRFNTALMSTTGWKQRCGKCFQFGHTTKNCNNKKSNTPDVGTNNKKFKFACWHCGKIGHKRSECNKLHLNESANPTTTTGRRSSKGDILLVCADYGPLHMPEPLGDTVLIMRAEESTTRKLAQDLADEDLNGSVGEELMNVDPDVIQPDVISVDMDEGEEDSSDESYVPLEEGSNSGSWNIQGSESNDSNDSNNSNATSADGCNFQYYGRSYSIEMDTSIETIEEVALTALSPAQDEYSVVMDVLEQHEDSAQRCTQVEAITLALDSDVSSECGTIWGVHQQHLRDLEVERERYNGDDYMDYYGPPPPRTEDLFDPFTSDEEGDSFDPFSSNEEQDEYFSIPHE